MSEAFHDLVRRAMSLAPGEREAQRGLLDESLRHPDDPEWLEGWVEVAQQRLEAHQRGESSSIPADQAISQARARAAKYFNHG